MIYVGQILSAFTFTGGEANVEGSFAWANGNTVITESGDYQVIFTPADTGEYASLAAVVHIDATQLTVTVTVGEHGSADPLGIVNVNYGDALPVTFKADLGYAVSSVTLDGASVEASGKYTVSDIKESHTLHAEFEESESTVSISCIEGSDGCYTSVSYSRSTYYYYSIPIETGYSSFKFFMYSSTQQQGSEEEYTVCSDYITWNTACDTFALSKSGSSVKYSWTNYTTSSSGGMGGMGGMQDGNSNKSEYSTKGLKAGNDITISAGTVNIKAYDDAIHANADTTLENGESSTGNVTVSGGTLTLYSADDGIHADGTLSVSGGSINITKCYEGLEGAYIHVTNGSVSIVSSDDGINSPTTSGTRIRISGGTVYIYANGDGIDSNSRTSYSGIVFEGGKVLVISTSKGNSAIDTEAGYSYTGGSVLAIMPSGGMTSESTKCNNTSAMAKKTISLSSGSYLTVSVSSTTVVTVKMPCSLSAMVIYLGNSSASMSSSSSSSAVLEENGVAWN